MAAMMRLLIADDHELLRDTLGSFLRQQEGIEILSAADTDEAQKLVETSGPFDLVLLDYGMPGMDALRGLRRILEMPDAPPVVLMSGFAPREIVEAALQMGVRGFLHKSMPATSLLNAIRFMALGERYVPVDYIIQGEAPRLDMPQAPGADVAPGVAAALTAREKEVLVALCRGSTNKEIARDMGLSEPTIKLHVKTLYRRLGVSNRTQAAMVAQSHGLS